VYVTGQPPVVGEAPVGTIGALSEHGLLLQISDTDMVWIPATAITGLRSMLGH
jgi:hypothetical protein